MFPTDLTYEDYKHRITMAEVLQDADYHFYRRDGLRYPSFVKLDSTGHRIRGDKFIVTGGGAFCFRPPERRVYNIISFIKSFPEMFADYRPGMSPDRLVNLVCRRLLNVPQEVRKSRIIQPVKERKPFRMEDYIIIKDTARMMPYFKARGISEDTVKAFSACLCLAAYKGESGKKGFTNLSFPTVIPGAEGIVGLEQRGYPDKEGKSTYKGKALGSNSSEGLWIANLTNALLSGAKEVLWFESAYDAMACYQLNPQKSVFVSTGGSPTDGQIRGMLSVTPDARHFLGFDKDQAGKQFVARFREVALAMDMPRENVQAYHPLGPYKDWNEALVANVSGKDPNAGMISFENDVNDRPIEIVDATKPDMDLENPERRGWHR